MTFDQFDKQLRVYETNGDTYVLPNMYMVARLDGRGFTKLTKEKHSFDAPFDITFHQYMLKTVKHLMKTGFKVIYAYTQSDEISLLFDLDEKLFGRNIRKYNSILAGEASACFSLQLGAIGVFDCRISQFPTSSLVIDYFRWRQEDSHRNSLNAYCYWKLREEGLNKREATKRISGISIAEKNELLFSLGINYNDLPSWQKRGTGIYSESKEVEGYNPQKDEQVKALRNVLYINEELPFGLDYNTLLSNIFQTK